MRPVRLKLSTSPKFEIHFVDCSLCKAEDVSGYELLSDPENDQFDYRRQINVCIKCFHDQLYSHLYGIRGCGVVHLPRKYRVKTSYATFYRAIDDYRKEGGKHDTRVVLVCSCCGEKDCVRGCEDYTYSGIPLCLACVENLSE